MFLLQYDPAAREAIVAAAKPARAVLVGGLTFDAPPSVSTLATNPPRNSLIALEPDGSIGGIYSKWHLVPFGEYAPGWVPFAIKIVPGQPRLRQRSGDAVASRPAAVRRLDLLRGRVPGPGGGRGAPAGLDGQHHQRRLVRQLDRPAAASHGGEDADGGGGPAAHPRGEHGYFSCVRRKGARIGATRAEHGWSPRRTDSWRAAADVIFTLGAGYSGHTRVVVGWIRFETAGLNVPLLGWIDKIVTKVDSWWLCH